METIQANRIEVQDEAGVVKILLDACSPEGGVIRLMGDELCGIELATSKTGASIKMFANTGAVAAQVAVSNEHASLVLYGADGKPGVVLECNEALRAVRILVDGKMIWGKEILIGLSPS